MINELYQHVDKTMIRLRKYREILVTGVLFCFFLYLRIFIGNFMDLEIVVWRFIGPDFWPSWILNFAVLISAVLFYGAIKEVWREMKDSAGQQAGEPAREDATAKELGRTMAVVGTIFVYLYLMDILGFLVGTTVFGIVYLLLVRERRPLILLALPTFLVLLIYFVFTKVLVVPLPRGTGIFRMLSYFFF